MIIIIFKLSVINHLTCLYINFNIINHSAIDESIIGMFEYDTNKDILDGVKLVHVEWDQIFQKEFARYTTTISGCGRTISQTELSFATD